MTMWRWLLTAAAAGAATWAAVRLWRARRPRVPAFPATARVATVHLYPVKSCAPARDVPLLSFAAAHGPGPDRDRRWMVVWEDTGEMVTQRTVPQMCFVTPQLEPDPSNPEDDVLLVLRCAKGSQEPLRLRPVSNRHQSKRRKRRAPTVVQVRVWDDVVDALDEGDEAASWLTALLGERVRLVQYRDGRDDVGDFADSGGVLLTSTASLDALNTGINGRTVPMLRFRPNVVVGGVDAPWLEDELERVQIGGAVFEVTELKTRCLMTNVNFRTGATDVDNQPYRELMRTRRADGESRPRFGVCLRWVDGDTVVRPGDRVVPLPGLHADE